MPGGGVILAGSIAQEKEDGVRGGKFGGCAKPTVLKIVVAAILFRHLIQQRLHRLQFHLFGAGETVDVVSRRICRRLHLLRIALPLPPGGEEDGQQLFLGQIGGCKDRLPVWCGQNSGRPPAGASEHLTGQQIDRVNVWPFLPVHLHRDEMRPQKIRHFLIRKALPGNDMAPVAGGVADGEEEQLLLLLRPLERLGAPGIPVHRVVLMHP